MSGYPEIVRDWKRHIRDGKRHTGTFSGHRSGRLMKERRPWRAGAGRRSFFCSTTSRPQASSELLSALLELAHRNWTAPCAIGYVRIFFRTLSTTAKGEMHHEMSPDSTRATGLQQRAGLLHDNMQHSPFCPHSNQRTQNDLRRSLPTTVARRFAAFLRIHGSLRMQKLPHAQRDGLRVEDHL